MRQTIVILEDNVERIAAMDDCLGDKFPFFERRFFRAAPPAIAWLTENVQHAVCISLDHDLDPESAGDPDPGTGRDVADFLAKASPRCPVIFHSTNRTAVDGMEMALTDSGWGVERIMPYDGCRWIAEAWLPLIREAIVRAAAVESSAVPARSR
jgi:hypothetical protein